MAQTDLLTNSDGDVASENAIELQSRLSTDRLQRRVNTYREQDITHAAHYNNSIDVIVEEHQKQTSQLQQKSSETKTKKTTKKSEKRDHSLVGNVSKANRSLECDSDLENPGKKQKLNDGSAVNTDSVVDRRDISSSIHQPFQRKIKSPVNSPVMVPPGNDLQPEMDGSLDDINLATDHPEIKMEVSDLFMVEDPAFWGCDIQKTISTYLDNPVPEYLMKEIDNIKEERDYEDICNMIVSDKFSDMKNYDMCNEIPISTGSPSQIPTSNTNNYLSDMPNNCQINDFPKLRMPVMAKQTDNIPASQTLKQMAEVHQTKVTPANCSRSMLNYKVNSYQNTNSLGHQRMPNYMNVSNNDYSPNMRHRVPAVSPNITSQIAQTPSTMSNVQPLSSTGVSHGHPSLKQQAGQLSNQNCSILQGPQRIIKKPSTSPINQATQLGMTHKTLNQPMQVQQNHNGTIQSRMQTDPNLHHNQAGIMTVHNNQKSQLKPQGITDQGNNMSQYQNSVPNMEAYNPAGPSVPNSSPFSTSFCNGSTNNIRTAYPCQNRMPLQNQVQSGSHQPNPYMPGQVVNNVALVRGQNKQVLRGPPPDYRQAAMMQHVGSPPLTQDVNQMPYHPAAYRQTLQQANQVMPPNVKMMNPNMTGFGPGTIQRHRPSGPTMNSLPMSQQVQQNSTWMQRQGLGHEYQDPQMNMMQRNPQIMDAMAMHNVSNNSNNSMNMQQCIQMVPRMRHDVPNIRRGMHMQSQVVGHMNPSANMNPMNKQCQMQTIPNNVRALESYNVGVNNNVINHLPNSQLTAANMSNLSHSVMQKVQLPQMNTRQNPVGMPINQTMVTAQMMQGNTEMMQSVGMNTQMGTYPQNIQVPNHINGLSGNNPMAHHMASNVILHNSNQVQGPLMPPVPDVKSEPNSQNSQPSTPNNDYEMMYPDSSFHNLLK